MAIYSDFRYYPEGDENAVLYTAGSATGVSTLSVEPFTATALDYDTINLSWTYPVSANYHAMRITRNQDGIPDNPEDGRVMWEDLGGRTAGGTGNLEDKGIDAYGETAELAPGKHVYYSFWIWLGTALGNEWHLCGTTSALVPESHQLRVDQGTGPTTHEKFLDLLPRVLTSSQMSALGTVDYDSDLSKFTSAMTFTMDELMTYVDLILPNSDYTNLTPELLNAVAFNLGLPAETRLSTTYQKKLVREALNIYREKGTYSGLSNFLESLTGFSPSITPSSNLMLDAASSTFYKGVGHWEATSGATISSTTEEVPPNASECSEEEVARRVDFQYTGRVVVATADASISIGNTQPATRGIPVSADVAYSVSFYQKTATTLNYTIGVSWYNSFGHIIGAEETTSSLAATSAWERIVSDPMVSPAGAAYAGIRIQFSATSSAIYLDMVQFSDYSAETYSEARGIGVELSPSKVNYITNPSFEAGTGALDGWTTTNGTTTAVDISPVIPGVYTGAKMANIASTSAASVSIKTTTAESLFSTGEYTFSTYIHSATVPTAGYTTTLEIYPVDPYSNLVKHPTITATSSEWDITAGDDGAVTETYPSTGGVENGAWVKETISTYPTSGDVTFGVNSTGITQTLHGNTDYLLKVWVYSTRNTVLYPQVTWEFTGEDDTVDLGDAALVEAGTWTQIQFTSTSPFEVDAMSVALISPVEALGDHEGWLEPAVAATDYLGFSTVDFGYKTFKTTEVHTPDSWDNLWQRISVSTFVEDGTVIPFDKDGLSASVTIAYTSNGTAVHLDGAQLEARAIPSDYFDGASADGEWADVADKSISNYYSSKDAKLARLGQELTKYIPMSTPYYVSLNGSVEFAGEFKGYA
jgi:phage tail-like protein